MPAYLDKKYPVGDARLPAQVFLYEDPLFIKKIHEMVSIGSPMSTKSPTDMPLRKLLFMWLFLGLLRNSVSCLSR